MTKLAGNQETRSWKRLDTTRYWTKVNKIPMSLTYQTVENGSRISHLI